jgi:hypothetical protein
LVVLASGRGVALVKERSGIGVPCFERLAGPPGPQGELVVAPGHDLDDGVAG